MDNMDESVMVRLRRFNCRSLRDLFCAVIAVATISVVITYHISKYLPPRQQTELKIQFNGRVDIYRNVDPLPPGGARSQDDSNHGNSLGDRRHGLEGMDVEAWEKRMRERRKLKEGAARHKLRPELVNKLKQIDQEVLLLPPGAKKVAVIQGSSEMIAHQGAFYEQSLEGAGYTIIKSVTSTTENDTDTSHHGYSRQLWDTGWTLGLCLRSPTEGATSSHCPSTSAFKSIKSFQKMNSIPALDSMFSTRWKFCVTMTAARYIPAVHSRAPLSPLCYTLPHQYQDFLTRADARGPATKWVLKPLSPDGGPIQLVEPVREKDYQKIKRLSQTPALVQEYQTDPLPLFGLPFSVTVYVLVTSWRPLRAHLHTVGIVHFRHDYQHNFRKVPGRTWSLDQWLHHLVETRSQSTADLAKRNIESIVTQTLLASEVVDTDEGLPKERCSSCFQLLSFELIFNSTFYPMILSIASNPDLSELIRHDNWAHGTHSNSVIRDMVTMVMSTTDITTDVAMALEELNLEMNLSAAAEDMCTRSSLQTCLTSHDIAYFLSLRRESVQKGQFRQLYPSIEADKYSQFIADLDKYTQLRRHRRAREVRVPRALAAADHTQPSVHTTADLHTLAVSFLRYLHNLQQMEEAYDDLNIPLFSDLHVQSKDPGDSLLENIHRNTSHTEEKYSKHTCIEDKPSMPYIDAIYTDPPLDMSPQFNASSLEYYATVPYHVFLVKVWAFAVSCYSEARLQDKYGLSRPSNITLGLGNNKISVLVVDVRHTEPWIINTYTVYIYRQAASEGLTVLDHRQPHTVCTLTQDCGLRYLPTRPCGLQPSDYVSWQHYQKHATVLPSCEHGDEQGEWLVPCSSCGRPDSCSWSTAVWQPRTCNHPVIPRESLKQCLSQKQILFIGDSTNRGIMHYLMEQVNDTLTEWDKTHDVKIYTNINQEQTSVSFAYYPQFWLPANQRPVFDKALFDLIKQAGPLENNHNTVLVVGGVHWLATHHLKVISQALRRENLEHIRVIVKGLGAGFHQPVDGLHCLTLTEQRKLLIHNTGLVDFARTLGFQVVDTFNMTMARYKDFLQGKCACHFHRVKEVLPSFTQYLRSTGQNHEAKLVDMPILYHVEGNINAAYSEILLNRVCDYK